MAEVTTFPSITARVSDVIEEIFRGLHEGKYEETEAIKQIEAVVGAAEDFGVDLPDSIDKQILLSMGQYKRAQKAAQTAEPDPSLAQQVLSGARRAIDPAGLFEPENVAKVQKLVEPERMKRNIGKTVADIKEVLPTAGEAGAVVGAQIAAPVGGPLALMAQDAPAEIEKAVQATPGLARKTPEEAATEAERLKEQEELMAQARAMGEASASGADILTEEPAAPAEPATARAGTGVSVRAKAPLGTIRGLRQESGRLMEEAEAGREAAEVPQAEIEAEAKAIKAAAAQMEVNQARIGEEYARASVAQENLRRRDEVFRELQEEKNQKLNRIFEQKRELATRKVDPRGPLADTGNRVIASIATAMGAMASTYMGGPNQAAQIIDDAITRDLSEQKRRIAEGMELADDEANLVQAQFRDKVEADLITREALWEKYTRAVDHYMRQTTNEAQKAQLSQLSANLQQKKLDASLRTAEHQERLATQMATASVSAGLQAQRLASAGAGAKGGLPTMPGYIRFDPNAHTKAGDKTARDISEAYEEARGAILAMVEGREQEGWIAPGEALASEALSMMGIGEGAAAKTAKRMVNARAQMVNAIRRLQGMGARFERLEEELMAQQVPDDPTGINPLIPTQLRQALKILDELTAKKLAVYGWKPAGSQSRSASESAERLAAMKALGERVSR